MSPQLSNTARPEAFPLWDTSEPYSPPSGSGCPAPGAECGAAHRHEFEPPVAAAEQVVRVLPWTHYLTSGCSCSTRCLRCLSTARTGYRSFPGLRISKMRDSASYAASGPCTSLRKTKLPPLVIIP